MLDAQAVFMPLAKSMATAEADKLEVQGKLASSREAFIKEKESTIFHTLENSYHKLINDMQTVNTLLHDELKTLPKHEKERYEKEFALAQKQLDQLITSPQSKKTGTWQDFLHISKETLLFVYRTGYHYYEQEKFESACSIFQFLVILNSSVSDFWTALGFAHRSLSHTEKALDAFAIATILNTTNPTPRYQLADLYISLGLFNDATVEINTLSELAKKNPLPSLEHEIETLRAKIKK